MGSAELTHPVSGLQLTDNLHSTGFNFYSETSHFGIIFPRGGSTSLVRVPCSQGHLPVLSRSVNSKYEPCCLRPHARRSQPYGIATLKEEYVSRAGTVITSHG